MQFVKRKENSKFLHQMEKPRTRETKEVYLECDDWLSSLVDFLNENYEVKVPIGGIFESGKEKKIESPAYFTYKCYDADLGYVELSVKRFNIGQIWGTKFESLSGTIDVKEGEDIPPKDIIRVMANDVLTGLREENKREIPHVELPIKVLNRKTGELVVS
jgi:hypothetical protein